MSCLNSSPTWRLISIQSEAIDFRVAFDFQSSIKLEKSHSHIDYCFEAHWLCWASFYLCEHFINDADNTLRNRNLWISPIMIWYFLVFEIDGFLVCQLLNNNLFVFNQLPKLILCDLTTTLWYAVILISILLENVAGAPFKQ